MVQAMGVLSDICRRVVVRGAKVGSCTSYLMLANKCGMRRGNLRLFAKTPDCSIYLYSNP